jgi:hypothetical protein
MGIISKRFVTTVMTIELQKAGENRKHGVRGRAIIRHVAQRGP